MTNNETESKTRLPILEDAEAASQKPLMTVYQVARLGGIGEHSVRRMIDAGDIRAVHVGRRIRVVSSDVRRMFGLES